jgi:hypothetical protein
MLDGRAWLADQVVADGAETMATWAACDRLPKRGARRALAIAAASTAIAVLDTTRLGGPTT